MTPALAKWEKGLKNEEAFGGCGRCEAELDEEELVVADDDEVDHAWAELARLEAEESGEWQCEEQEGLLARCPTCRSERFLVVGEREVALAATFILNDGSVYPEERRFLSPWAVQCHQFACSSCRTQLHEDELLWRQPATRNRRVVPR